MQRAGGDAGYGEVLMNPDDLLKSETRLNDIGTSAESVGNILGAFQHWEYGLQAQQSAQYQAAQLRQNAGNALAASQRNAYDIDRQSQYVASAALAAAAAGGGGASDPTVISIIARNAGEMAYRKSLALYQGEDQARVMEEQAQSREFEGAMSRRNATLTAGADLWRAGTSLLRGEAKGASLKARFGAGMPGMMYIPQALGE